MKPNSKLKTLTRIFLDLVRIPSPSGHEEAVAKYVRQFLNECGWQTTLDAAGNVIAERSLSGNNTNSREHPIVFVAHMDTVQKTDEIVHPQFNGKRFISDGTTILGADNKASIAVLLILAHEIFRSKKQSRVVLIFTTREELGTMGSSALSLTRFQPKLICNIDGSSRIGTIDYRSYGQLIFSLTVTGRAAHAAIEPEKGVHAIAILAKIINAIRLGKTESKVVNIGSISGGGATNIIPGSAQIRGEIRSYSKKVIDVTLQKIYTKATKTAKKYGAIINVTIVEHTPPFIGTKHSNAVKAICAAIEKSGLKPVLQSASYTSDASFLSNTGYPTVTLCRGGLKPHSTDESISLQEMEQLLAILKNVVVFNY